MKCFPKYSVNREKNTPHNVNSMLQLVEKGEGEENRKKGKIYLYACYEPNIPGRISKGQI